MAASQESPEEISLWQQAAPPAATSAALEGEHACDIAIVGAGVAGLSLALHLATAGYKPTVLEAVTPGADSTGKSGGIVTSLSFRYGPDELQQRYDAATANKLLSLIGSSGGYMFSLIRDLGLQCDPQASGFLAPARDSSKLKRLRTMAEQWQRAGFDISYIEAEQTRYLSGVNMYRGALLDNGGGAVNPLSYARELGRVAVEKGVELFTNSAVKSVQEDGGQWLLHTDKGRLRANKVILCASAGNRYLHPALSTTSLALNVYEMASRPLDAEIRKTILPEKHSLTDVHADLFTMRYDVADRLVTACPAFIGTNSTQRAIRYTSNRLRKVSPLLADVDIEFIWTGTAQLDPTQLPRFFDLGKGLYAIQACNGRGLAMNTMLGSQVADFFISAETDMSKLLVEQPSPITAYPLMNRLPGLLVNIARCRTNLVDKLTSNQRYR